MKAYLILENGTVFEGEGFGAEIGAGGCVFGEAVFTTFMNGFVETLTDPAMFGAIAVQTFPMAGNYGANEGDAESLVGASGLVVRELCDKGSSFRKSCELGDFLKKRGIVGISGIDTRELTGILQSGGAQNAMIAASTENLPQKLKALAAFKRENCLESCSLPPTTTGKGRRVVLWDFGAKNSLVSLLENRGCEVVRLPHDCCAADVLSFCAAGIIIAGGGSPVGLSCAAKEVRAVMESGTPILGVGLGHLLLCLAAGGRIKKLKSGHRGGNQPVIERGSGRVIITSQNHGYAAVSSSVEGAVESFVNVNDKTCEGLCFEGFPAISVQFDPVCDAVFVLDRFLGGLKD